MHDEGYWLASVITWAVLVGKLPALIRSPRDPLLRTVCTALSLVGTSFLFASPAVIGGMNRLTGVPNFSAPWAYSIITALSASCLVLIVYWRGGAPDQVRRTARRWMLGYAVAIVALVTLFMLGKAPVESRVEFDTYYANTPFIREMIVLYLLVNTVAAAAVVVLCWRWSNQVTGRAWLRWGLRTIVLGYIFNLGFDGAKFAAVAARWADVDWDRLNSVGAPQFAALGAFCAATGFVLPLVGGHVSEIRSGVISYRTYRALGPLWGEIRIAATHSIVASVPVPWWAVGLRLTRRLSEIHDGCLALRPYYDSRVAVEALQRADREGVSPANAREMAETAVLIDAIRNKIMNTRPTPDSSSGPDLPFALDEPLRVPALIQASHALRINPVAIATS